MGVSGTRRAPQPALSSPGTSAATNMETGCRGVQGRPTAAGDQGNGLGLSLQLGSEGGGGTPTLGPRSQLTPLSTPSRDFPSWEDGGSAGDAQWAAGREEGQESKSKSNLCLHQPSVLAARPNSPHPAQISGGEEEAAWREMWARPGRTGGGASPKPRPSAPLSSNLTNQSPYIYFF